MSYTTAKKTVCQQFGGNSRSWEDLDFPSSGVGDEYFFRHKKTGKEVYVCIDQGEITSCQECSMDDE